MITLSSQEQDLIEMLKEGMDDLRTEIIAIEPDEIPVAKGLESKGVITLESFPDGTVLAGFPT